MTSDGETLLLQKVADGVVSLVLLKACFRVGPDLTSLSMRISPDCDVDNITW